MNQLFDAALEIVKFHHSGHLHSYQADEEAAYEKLAKAWDLLQETDKERTTTPSGREVETAEFTQLQLATINKIREFAPNLIASLVDYHAIWWKVHDEFYSEYLDEMSCVDHSDTEEYFGILED